MKYLIFGDENQESFGNAFLIKESGLQETPLRSHYFDYLENHNINIDDFVVFGCPYNSKNKAPASDIKEYFADMLPQMVENGIHTITVADTAYFKVLANAKKAEGNYGKILPCAIKGFEHLNVIIIPNYQALIHNPSLEAKITVSLRTLIKHIKPTVDVDKDKPVKVTHLHNPDEIVEALQDLVDCPMLSVDIEGYSLDFYRAGIGTISFAKNKHEAIAFPCDLDTSKAVDTFYHGYTPNYEVREIIYDFLLAYEGKLLFHNAPYDTKVLIHYLFCDGVLGNTKGIVDAVRHFYGRIEDSKLITYLATNNAVKNVLDLKSHALEYVGAYAEEDIDDIRLIPCERLLEYNGVDACATWYVYEKHMQTVIQDEQLDVYNTIFKPSISVVIHMELSGMPMNRKRTIQVHRKLKYVRKTIKDKLKNSAAIKDFTKLLRQKESDAQHAKWKTKTAPIEHFNYVKFNPNSPIQVSELLYKYMELPVLDTTKNGNPSTKADHIKKLLHHTDSEEYKEVIKLLREYGDVKILIQNFTSTFLEKMVKHADGWYYLHGSFNLGGTKSGRLSSSDPNLQNIPNEGNPFAKLIKMCFEAPDGWVLIGADFASLEDRISALITKDPNKIKVYTDGYDGHCLRTFIYFTEQMPDIDPTSVESINSIKNHPEYKKLRSISKAPTFSLTYMGTKYTLMNNQGFTDEEATKIYNNYHELYKASDDWVEERVKFAAKHGYTVVAFGFRMRTPTLKKSVYGTRSMPKEAMQEKRTVGNAQGQSYGMLNNRSAIEIQQELLDSPYAYDMLPIAHIHDAQYFTARADSALLEWANELIPRTMDWQDLDAIRHDEVGLGGELDVFYPNWAFEVTLPKNATASEIECVVNNHIDEVYSE